MTTDSKDAFCPECATVMRINGKSWTGAMTYQCPSCKYESHMSAGTAKDFFLFGWDKPPADKTRCLNCGAFTFGEAFAGRTLCRRCGAADPNARQPAAQRPIQDASAPQPYTPPPPQYVQPPQPQSAGYPPLTFAAPTDENPKPNYWGIGLGAFTILGDLAQLAVLLILAGIGFLYNAGGIGNLSIIPICILSLFALFGLVAGILSIASRKKTGRILCGVYWLISLIFWCFIILI